MEPGPGPGLLLSLVLGLQLECRQTLRLWVPSRLCLQLVAVVLLLPTFLLLQMPLPCPGLGCIPWS